MSLAKNLRYFRDPGRLKPLQEYGIMNRFNPGNPTLRICVERAPDSGGSPGTYAEVTRVGPFPKSGGFYFDPLSNDGLTYWYRARHVDLTGTVYGSYTTAVSGTPRLLDDLQRAAYLTAPGGNVITEDINPLAVTTATLNDDAVTNAKVADDAIQTAQLAAEAVTPPESQSRRRCKVSATANQTIANNTETTVNWDAESFDVGGLHDNATNNSRITIPTGYGTGLWLIKTHIVWASNATSYRVARIRKNGTTDIAVTTVTPVNGTTTAMDLIAVDSSPSDGDYYEVRVLQPTGGNLNVEMDSTTYAYSAFEAIHLW